jgi:general secretion pathway protein C
MMDGDPVKTSLPIELMGIILLKDRLKSVASVSDRGKNDVLAVKVNERISPEALVQEILEDRVIFLNKSTNRREYIDLPEEMKRLKTKQVSGVKTGGITKMSETHMAVDRSEVDKALTDLNTVLTQARCVPNMENGKSAGFRCFQIVPGSIYDKIGMQNGDVVCGINGTELTDPGQAFELFNQLKTANSIELCIKRNRQTMNIQYDIQ